MTEDIEVEISGVPGEHKIVMIFSNGESKITMEFEEKYADWIGKSILETIDENRSKRIKSSVEIPSDSLCNSCIKKSECAVSSVVMNCGSYIKNPKN